MLPWLSAALLVGLLRRRAETAARPEPLPSVSSEQSLAWGPGLQAALALPVRYFYLQAVGSDGRNFTRSPPGQFRVSIKPLSPKENIQIHVPDLLDRNDGSFLMRYRMYASVKEGLKVEILYGPIYHEYCECPEEDAQVWEKSLSCLFEEAQITEDFAAFSSIDFQQMFNEVPLRFGQKMGAIVHYTILSNRIYRRTVHLPDMEFYLNVTDWPVEHRKANDTPGPVPILSWCGSVDTADIVLPTYDVTHSTLETLRGVTNDLLSIQGNSPIIIPGTFGEDGVECLLNGCSQQKFPFLEGTINPLPAVSPMAGPVWEKKTEQGFFIGRDSREERLQLVKLSKENPELLDAGITGYFFFREKEKELGKVPLIGFFDFFQYKYQVSVDGTAAVYRFPYLLLGDSVVMKQSSPYYEHFYKMLRPWNHYVPVKRNLGDLLEKIKWTKENDEVVRKIAKQGQVAARELLQPHRFYCYYFRVFQEYAERQTIKPEIRDGMEFVPQPDDRTSLCDCHRKKPSKDEL